MQGLVSLRDEKAAATVVRILKTVWTDEIARAAETGHLPKIWTDKTVAVALEASLRRIKRSMELDAIQQQFRDYARNTTGLVAGIKIIDETSLFLVAAVLWAAWVAPPTPPSIILVAAVTLLLRSIMMPTGISRVYERVYRKEQDMTTALAAVAR